MKVLKINLVTNNAVNIDSTIPRARVAANPLIDPVPFTLSTKAAISVVILPSKIADKALL